MAIDAHWYFQWIGLKLSANCVDNAAI